jgi:hypothetical protein
MSTAKGFSQSFKKKLGKAGIPGKESIFKHSFHWLSDI